MIGAFSLQLTLAGADLGGGCRGCAPPSPPEMTCGFLIQLVFCKKKETMWFIGVEVEQETSAPRRIAETLLFTRGHANNTGSS